MACRMVCEHVRLHACEDITDHLRIVVKLDEASHEALELAQRLAQEEGEKTIIIMLHVCNS